jgi:signal transduction histidine kinase
MVRVGLRVNSTRQQLVLTVTDDGRGISATSAGGSGGLGLVGLRERAALLGGRLDVMPRRGGGTTIRAVIPRGNVVPLEGGA